jgi:hypothetical protein
MKIPSRQFVFLTLLTLAAALLVPSGLWAGTEVTEIGSRRELFVDQTLVESVSGGASLRLHHPTIREMALLHDEPWEGTGSGYHSIFKDGYLYRMYYKAYQISPMHEADPKNKAEVHPLFCAYAESDDGIHWRKPNLGLHEFAGSTANNIVMVSGKTGNLDVDAGHPAVFKDTNPNAPSDARYKAILRSREPRGLLAFKSPDGLHWSPLIDRPVIVDGAFDSQNLAFWDGERGEYRAYWRFFDAGTPEKPYEGVRSIRTATSKDFIHWENQADLNFGDSPREHLYTNQIKPYDRAPHLFIGFPTRYRERGHVDRGDAPHKGERTATQAELVAQWPESLRALPDPGARLERAAAHERYGAAITEGLFMASRDGVSFKRWNEAFLPPGIEREGTWNYGHQYLGWHAVETKSDLAGAPNELSLYAGESYWTAPGSALRRYTLRLDGFVSVEAGADGGELLTKPITFSGRTLALNFATSAAGSVKVEIQDIAGRPLPGFALPDCEPLFGDTIERAIRWQQGSDVSTLAGRPVRLRFVLTDADVYAYRFTP